jgi:CBS domain-containing protein
VTPRRRRQADRLLAPLLWAGGLVLVVLGNGIAGMALVTAGWFARSAVRASRRRDQLERLIEGVTVGEVMETEPLVVAPQATLDTFGNALDATGSTTVARVMRDGHLVGLVGPRELAGVPRGRWSTVHAGEAMAASASLPVLTPGEALRPAADRLGASRAPGFPVLEDGRLAGILTRLAVGRTLHERMLGELAATTASSQVGSDEQRPG